jgi:hypothetical protein
MRLSELKGNKHMEVKFFDRKIKCTD